jgi:hypothetical protein
MGKLIKLTESELLNVIKKIIKEHTESNFINKDDVMTEEDQKVMLRKLALKSILGDESGIYKGWTVEKLLNNAPKKLYYIYTHYEKISFVDDVLDALKEKGFPVKRINKPGVDKDQYMDYTDTKSSRFLANVESKSIEDIERLIKAKGMNKQKIDPRVKEILKTKKREHDKSYKVGKNIEKRSVMQAKNHNTYKK